MTATAISKNTKYNLTTVIRLVAIVFGLSYSPVQSQPPSKKPNIIFILADDLGYGDVSCYGQRKFKTPHIDKLADQGIRFTSHYAGAPVCAPSRSALLTGLHTGTYTSAWKQRNSSGGSMANPSVKLSADGDVEVGRLCNRHVW